MTIRSLDEFVKVSPAPPLVPTKNAGDAGRLLLKSQPPLLKIPRLPWLVPGDAGAGHSRPPTP